jgi:hypothetical protein
VRISPSPSGHLSTSTSPPPTPPAAPHSTMLVTTTATMATIMLVLITDPPSTSEVLIMRADSVASHAIASRHASATSPASVVAVVPSIIEIVAAVFHWRTTAILLGGGIRRSNAAP